MVYLGQYGKWKITVSIKLQFGNISPGTRWATLRDKSVKDARKELHNRYVITTGEVYYRYVVTPGEMRPMVAWHLFAKYFMHSHKVLYISDRCCTKFYIYYFILYLF